MKKINFEAFFLIITFMLFTYMTCGRDTYPSSSNPGTHSIATGVKYNTEDGLKVQPLSKLITGSGVYIEGGSISLSNDFNGGDFLKGSPPTKAKNVTVPSMVVDRTPVTNIYYREMIDWLKKNAPDENFYKKLYPDEKVWFREFSFNDPLINNYFGGGAFKYHPVVGVSWVQATFYCWWRTFRVNLRLITDMKKYDLNSDFGGYTLAEIANCDLAEIADYDIAKFADLKLSEVIPKDDEDDEDEEDEDEENQEEEGFESEDEEDDEDEEDEDEYEGEPGKAGNLEELQYQGLLLCDKFRLPTEAEHAYYTAGSLNRRIKGGAVAKGALPDRVDPYYEVEQSKDYYNGTRRNTTTSSLASSSSEGIIVKDQKPNPWNGIRFRDERGRIAANFKQGPGEYSDGGITSHVYKYPPNNYGIFCFVGISEYLIEIYRPESAKAFDDLNPTRRSGKMDSASNYKYFNPLITDKTRTYIGPNYQDTISVGMYKRRPILETDKTSFIGFRCVQTVINDRTSSSY
ncbi:MAG: SUMF1/EgtB/PvdO family nonheme iron enzyme [Bacteroidetes bacterium]|nr:SUMF1/EgtB/PvdO family nonheme iron enzyme [Bacteroidota bacterium]